MILTIINVYPFIGPNPQIYHCISREYNHCGNISVVLNHPLLLAFTPQQGQEYIASLLVSA